MNRNSALILAVAATSLGVAARHVGLLDAISAHAAGTAMWVEPALLVVPTVIVAAIPTVLAWAVNAACTPAAPVRVGPELHDALNPPVPIEPAASDRTRGFNVIADDRPLPTILTVD